MLRKTNSAAATPVGGARPRHRLRRGVAGAGLLAATAVGLLAAGAGAASADTTGYTTHITPDNTFYLQLDVSGASTAPFAPVIDWYANGGANQTWTFTPIGGGDYEIVNQNSNQCLTTDGVAGDQLYQFYCDGDPGQAWNTNLPNNGAFTAYTISSPAYGLDVDVYGDNAWPGTAIDAWYPNGNANQAFGSD